MCELVNEMPKKKKSRNHKKTREILNMIKLEETTNPKKPYRFRMLFFKNPEINDREDPFVVKYVHEYSGTDDAGKLVYDYIDCPRSRHIKWNSNPYETCPMCVDAQKYFKSMEASEFKDEDAKAQFNKKKGKRIVLIPVFIVQDPNHPENNGKLGVVKIRESDMKYVKDEETGNWNSIDPYDVLEKHIDASVVNGVFPFNKNGVDLAITVIDHKVGTGETAFSYNKIDKLALTSKPYEIPDITDDFVKGEFSKTFDHECYTTVTPNDLSEWYDKYIGVNYDIPDDMDDVFGDDIVNTPKSDKKVSTAGDELKVIDTSDVTDPVAEDDIPMDFDDDIDNVEIDDLIDDVVESEHDNTVDESSNEFDDVDLDDLDALIDNM